MIVNLLRSFNRLTLEEFETLMLSEKATALVVRTSDWSETSRIATLFTREFGKVRVLAKGGRRLNSNFDVALDLLTLCSIVLLRKNSGLDLLTEARADERFPGLRSNLPALYAGYYIAELLGDGTQEHDPHPVLFDIGLGTLRNLQKTGSEVTALTMRFELAWLNELGYRPRLDACAICASTQWMDTVARLAVSPSIGGLICPTCEPQQRDRQSISRAAAARLRELGETEDSPGLAIAPLLQAELRHVLGQFVSFVLGRRPRLLKYLE
jgi:DNA repair protein RecO (recombination protein O)